jgi:hypothetical protein
VDEQVRFRDHQAAAQAWRDGVSERVAHTGHAQELAQPRDVPLHHVAIAQPAIGGHLAPAEHYPHCLSPTNVRHSYFPFRFAIKVSISEFKSFFFSKF